MRPAAAPRVTGGANRRMVRCLPAVALIPGQGTLGSPSSRLRVSVAAAGGSSKAVSRTGQGRSSRSSEASPATSTPVRVERKSPFCSLRSSTDTASRRPRSSVRLRAPPTAHDRRRDDAPDGGKGWPPAARRPPLHAARSGSSRGRAILSAHSPSQSEKPGRRKDTGRGQSTGLGLRGPFQASSSRRLLEGRGGLSWKPGAGAWLFVTWPRL
jgi:hypothetical protein